ncbi:MAG TPA: proteasome activator [Actinomycetota bacterium]
MTQTPDHTPETPRVPSISLPRSADGANPRPTPAEAEASEQGEAVISPAKVLRIGSMVRQLLEEVRSAPLDEAGRTRMREIYDISVRELASGLSPDLAAELNRVALPLEGTAPSEAELRVAQAQLVGWLEGLFHGIQAALFAQQAAARDQLAEMRGRGLPGPSPGPNRDQDRSPGEGLYL